jgi:hypothetical protein
MHDRVRHFAKQKTVDDGAWVQEAMWDWALISLVARTEQGKKEGCENALAYFKDYLKEMKNRAQVTANTR